MKKPTFLIVVIVTLMSLLFTTSCVSKSQYDTLKVQLQAAQNDYSSLQNQLQNTENQLSSSQSQVSSLQNSLQTTQNDLTATKDTLAQTQNELASSQSQLVAATANLAQTKTELLNTQTQLNSAQSALATSLQPPYTSIFGRQITWTWSDTSGGLHEWNLPVDTYRAYIEQPRPTQTLALKMDNGTVINYYDYRPYIIPAQFTNVVQDYSNNFTDGMGFAKEMFNLVTQLTTYESTDTARYPVETITEAGGDCKDLSILFATLLKASNFPFKLRLVYMDSNNATAPVKPNHSIIEVTYSGETIYVDCTTKAGWGYWQQINAWFFDIS